MNALQRAAEAVGRSWHRSKRAAARTAAWVRDGVTGSFDSARADHRIAIAWAAGAVLLLAWIGWTIYIWSKNGSTAGLGVLVSWPALFAVAAIVAAPFVGAGMLVHRHRLAGDEDSGADEKDESS